MPILTTGLNTTEQADAILTALRTELAVYGVSVVTRGRMWRLPDRPCVVLIGPSIDLEALGIGVEEGRWEWLILIARDVDDLDRRADDLDTWADAVMGILLDLSRTTDKFVVQGGEGPRRIEDEGLLRLIEQHGERIDPVMIGFTTRHEVNPPSC